MPTMRKELEGMLKESLKNDEWFLVTKGEKPFDWVEYESPDHFGYSFRVDSLTYGTCAFYQGQLIMRFAVYPLTELKRLIQNMKTRALTGPCRCSSVARAMVS